MLLPAAVVLMVSGALFSGRFGVVVAAIVRIVFSIAGAGKAPPEAEQESSGEGISRGEQVGRLNSATSRLA